MSTILFIDIMTNRGSPTNNLMIPSKSTKNGKYYIVIYTFDKSYCGDRMIFIYKQLVGLFSALLLC